MRIPIIMEKFITGFTDISYDTINDLANKNTNAKTQENTRLFILFMVMKRWFMILFLLNRLTIKNIEVHLE